MILRMIIIAVIINYVEKQLRDKVEINTNRNWFQMALARTRSKNNNVTK